MNALLIGFLVVLALSATAVCGMLVVRKIVHIDTLQSFNEVAGNMFQVVGTLYAVLLGLIVVDAMTSMSDLRVTIEKEANSVANIHILADGLPSKTKFKVQELTSNYVEAVIDDEWQAMQKCSYSKNAVLSLHALWGSLIECDPENDNQRDIRNLCLQAMTTLGDSRRTRLLSSIHGVSAELWTVLVAGGVLTILFTYFFGLKHPTGQVLMTAVVAASVSLNVYLVYLFGYPFSGAYRLSPEGFSANRLVFSLRKQGLDKLPDPNSIDIRKLEDAKGKLELMKK